MDDDLPRTRLSTEVLAGLDSPDKPAIGGTPLAGQPTPIQNQFFSACPKTISHFSFIDRYNFKEFRIEPEWFKTNDLDNSGHGYSRPNEVLRDLLFSRPSVSQQCFAESLILDTVNSS